MGFLRCFRRLFDSLDGMKEGRKGDGMSEQRGRGWNESRKEEGERRERGGRIIIRLELG